jgi:hypothetical protein
MALNVLTVVRVYRTQQACRSSKSQLQHSIRLFSGMNEIDITNLPKRKQREELLKALYHGGNVIRDGHYIVKNIGATTYISFDHLTPAELRAVAKLKASASK